MKKIISIFLLLGIALFPACEKTVTMDGSVDARVDAVIKSYLSELAAAPDGWIADIMTSQGIYRFYMVFSDGNMVTMYTDNFKYSELNGVPKTSTYNIRSLQRPTLSFDTYSYLAIINDPNDNISGGTGNMGLKTDFEFEIVGYTDGVFDLTGRVNRVKATLRKATAEEVVSIKAGGLMEVLTHSSEYGEGEFCYFMVDNVQVGVSLLPRSVSFSYVEGTDKVIESSEYIRTEQNNNIGMLEPVILAGQEMTGFTWDDAAQRYYAVLNNKPVVVEWQSDPIIPLHKMLGPGKNYTRMESIVGMFPSTDPEVNQFGALLVQTDNELKASFGMPLQLVALNFFTTKGGAPRMTMLSVVGGFSGWQTFYLTFNEEEDQFTVDKVTLEDDAHGNGALFYGASPSLANFWVGKTFKIEWSEVPFASYSMGQIVLVNGSKPATFYGACFAEE